LIKVINGNSIEELKKFPDNYFGSVVTDPPYGLSFMGKKWDYDVPSVELWKEVFRVLKEGGHLLAFAGTRTQHRMAVNIEDAGFEIRDMIAWVYGSGFPKSHNIGKVVDKLQGNERKMVGTKITNVGMKGNNFKSKSESGAVEITKSNSEWEGWGTALKPALEPITMARKPFKTSVAENVLKNGVGGINIDGCRVKLSKGENTKRKVGGHKTSYIGGKMKKNFDIENQANRDLGRFPANFIHDGSDEVKDLFPNTVSRFFYCAKASKQDKNEGLEDFEDKKSQLNSGGIGRKISVKKRLEKNGNNTPTTKNIHPTVKPTDLMRYLVRLVTPKNEIVLDCFMGSGSTGKACALEGLSFVGIDLDKDYCKIAKARIDKALEDKRINDSQTKLF
tara:strand:+ start:180 stop:1352 length:1173 start_codon:yes stop_codon:yes gene_type:complete